MICVPRSERVYGFGGFGFRALGLGAELTLERTWASGARLFRRSRAMLTRGAAVWGFRSEEVIASRSTTF